MQREHLWVHHERDATRYWKLAEGGYPSRPSVKQGETITLHISNSRSYYDVFVYREGARRELVHTISELRGAVQAVPEDGYANGFAWDATCELKIGDDWKSGVYIAEFPTAQGPREILFVVRPKEPRSPALLTLAMNTYNAYNNVGGKSLYDYISTDRKHSPLVSFERPMQPDVMGNFHIWDQFYTSWFDHEGYDIDYCVNADHDREPDLLPQYKANIRIGHDEYNTRDELEQLQRFVRGGGNIVMFAGNSLFVEVEYRSDHRGMYCDKAQYHNIPNKERPETCFLAYIDDLRQKTIGQFYTAFINAKTDDPNVFFAPVGDKYGFYKVARPEHWIFEGTGLARDEVFGKADSIVGVECDAADLAFDDEGLPYYTGADHVSDQYRILAIADSKIQKTEARRLDGIPDPSLVESYGTVAINETEFDGTVFYAATIEWGHGLYRDDSAVATITRNVMNRLAR